MHGSGTANSSWKSHSPRSAKPSIIWFTSALTAGSRAAICRGVKSGSRMRRYFAWSGGSICNGISGRTLPRSTASMFDENTSVRLSAISMSARRLRTTGPSGPGRNTGVDSRSILYIGWGSARPATDWST